MDDCLRQDLQRAFRTVAERVLKLFPGNYKVFTLYMRGTSFISQDERMSESLVETLEKALGLHFIYGVPPHPPFLPVDRAPGRRQEAALGSEGSCQWSPGPTEHPLHPGLLTAQGGGHVVWSVG